MLEGLVPFPSSSSVNPSHAGAHKGAPGPGAQVPVLGLPEHPHPPLRYQKFLEDSLVAETVKSLPSMQETRIQSLGQEDPLEKEMATHSSIPAWKIPWTEEPGGLQSMGSERIRH